jgi:hypothetical protein
MRKPAIILRISAAAIAATLLSLAVLLTLASRNLPRIALRSGGELRVIKVDYGTYHTFGSQSTLLNKLDRWIPQAGEWYGIASPKPTVAIWWGWWDPSQHRIVICPTGDATLILSSGEQQKIDFSQIGVGDIRGLLLDPPPNEPRLKIRFLVNDEPADLDLPNPAYHGGN